MQRRRPAAPPTLWSNYPTMKHFLLFSLSTATIFLASSIKLERPAVSRPVLEFSADVPSVPPVKMWLETPPVFYKNETIELFFAAPNAPFLGVIDPAGHFFYLIYPKENATGGLKPLVESADFTQMVSLKINTFSLKADPYQYGVSENRAVFTRSGKYTFIMGENLHVHNPDELEQVVIEYIHGQRPAQVVAMN